MRAFQTARYQGREVPGRTGEIWHRTGITPRRSDQLLAGGSIYWVFKRAVQVRQRIIELRSVACQDGVQRCEIILDRELVQTRPQPRRPFQGWRYLDPSDAPPDLASVTADLEKIPFEMRSALLELCLI
jgi:hypothetical protein